MNIIWNKIIVLYYYYFVVLFLYFCCCSINFIVCFLCWYCAANNNATANKTHQPGDWRLQKSYLLNPKNSKTYLILLQPIMCQKCIFLFPRAHFLEATRAPTEPAHENVLRTPIFPPPSQHPPGSYIRNIAVTPVIDTEKLLVNQVQSTPSRFIH